MCASYCGEGKACCRLRSGSDPPECQGATGYRSDKFTNGAPGEYHQCVTPGPALAFKLQGSGELRANGLWVQSGKHSGHPKYTKVHDSQMVIEWSSKRGAWRMYVQNFLGVNRDTLYQSGERTNTVPTTGWEAVLGLGRPPTISLIQPQEAPSGLAEVQALQNQSDVTPWDATPKGTHEAECNMDSEYNEKSGHWCLKPCPAGFINSGAQSCKQMCGGKYPAEGMGGICGIDQNEVMIATSEMAIELALGALDIHATYQQVQQQGVDVESLTHTANTLIDMGKNFAHPQCSEIMI